MCYIYIYIYIKRNLFLNKMSFNESTQQYIQKCKFCYYVFRLQVTIIRQTFQYMDRNM